MTSEPKVTYARDEASGRITEDSLNRMRARIGVEVPKDPFWQTFNIETTADAGSSRRLSVFLTAAVPAGSSSHSRSPVRPTAMTAWP